MKSYQCESKCPKCGSSDLEYEGYDVYGSYAYNDFTCLKCGAKATEICRLVYDETRTQE